MEFFSNTHFLFTAAVFVGTFSYVFCEHKSDMCLMNAFLIAVLAAWIAIYLVVIAGIAGYFLTVILVIMIADKLARVLGH